MSGDAVRFQSVGPTRSGPDAGAPGAVVIDERDQRRQEDEAGHGARPRGLSEHVLGAVQRRMEHGLGGSARLGAHRARGMDHGVAARSRSRPGARIKEVGLHDLQARPQGIAVFCGAQDLREQNPRVVGLKGAAPHTKSRAQERDRDPRAEVAAATSDQNVLGTLHGPRLAV